MTLITCFFALALHAFTDGDCAPTIDGIVPSSGDVGSSVAINGSHFSSVVDENRVCFGGVDAA
ncbi:MAG: hypothetical protein GY911_07560, partial [Actinomycetales bacterium]|nr:hypothetical protein [Actinomycetales bacterium]